MRLTVKQLKMFIKEVTEQDPNYTNKDVSCQYCKDMGCQKCDSTLSDVDGTFDCANCQDYGCELCML